jgi:hypothetical protein
VIDTPFSPKDVDCKGFEPEDADLEMSRCRVTVDHRKVLRFYAWRETGSRSPAFIMVMQTANVRLLDNFTGSPRMYSSCFRSVFIQG